MLRDLDRQAQADASRTRHRDIEVVGETGESAVKVEALLRAAGVPAFAASPTQGRRKRTDGDAIAACAQYSEIHTAPRGGESLLDRSARKAAFLPIPSKLVPFSMKIGGELKKKTLGERDRLRAADSEGRNARQPRTHAPLPGLFPASSATIPSSPDWSTRSWHDRLLRYDQARPHTAQSRAIPRRAGPRHRGNER
jgi:hypothetical protein